MVGVLKNINRRFISVRKLIGAPQNIFNGVTLFVLSDMHIQEFEEKVISKVIFAHPMVWGV